MRVVLNMIEGLQGPLVKISTLDVLLAESRITQNEKVQILPLPELSKNIELQCAMHKSAKIPPLVPASHATKARSVFLFLF